MEKTNALFLLILIFISGSILAQPMDRTINSGSVQFTFRNTKDKQIESIKIEGLQNIEEQNIENLLLLNLYPGEYFCSVKYFFRNNIEIERGKLYIEEGKRTIVSMSNKNKLKFSFETDVNSLPLPLSNNFATNHQGHPHQGHSQQGHPHQIPPQPHQEQAPQNIVEIFPISNEDFMNLYKTVESDTFNKLQIIKTATPFSYFETEQVRKLASLFVHESERLEAVKILSEKVLDIQNLPTLTSVFVHSSSKTEYLNYINTLR